MPFVHGLGKRVGAPGAHTDEGRLLDTELGGDLVCRAEANATDVAG